MNAESDILQRIAETLEARKQAEPDSSYTAGLFHKGLESISKKVGEEAVETLLAAQQDDDAHLIHETADLWFHTLVLLAHKGLGPDRVLAELERRFGRSGLAEKAARKRDA